MIDARLESAGVLLERLLPTPDPNAPKTKSSAIWPLPLAGRVELSAGFIQYKDYKIEPFDGILSLEPKRARLDVKEARMCGVSFPMEVEAEPEQSSAAAHITIKNEPLERTLHCLTGGNVQITGNVDLKAELRTQGQRPHLVRGLTGTVEAEMRKGRVKKFALLGSILSFRGIASLSEMKEEGFPYRDDDREGTLRERPVPGRRELLRQRRGAPRRAPAASICSARTRSSPSWSACSPTSTASPARSRSSATSSAAR